MSWDGIDRRKDHYCIQEHNVGRLIGVTKSLESLVNRVDKRVNGSFEAMGKHIEQGTRWRVAVIGIIFAGIFQIIAFSYFYGQLAQLVKSNTWVVEKIMDDWYEKAGK